MSSPTQTAAPKTGTPSFTRVALIATICAATIVTLAMGIRNSFGLFLRPIGMDLNVGREVFSFAIAMQNLLWGAAQPFIGALADRFGSVKVVLATTVLYAAGLALAAMSHDPLGLNITLGVMIGVALAGTTFVVLLGAVGRLVPPEKRTLAFGIITAGGSFGQFAVVPGAQALLDGLTWRPAMTVLAGLALGMLIFTLGLRKADQVERPVALGGVDNFGGVLKAAFAYPGYWLLILGFFVCGFHVAFVGTHLPGYLTDRGLDARIGAWALALIGLFNIAGSFLFGMWGGRHSKKGLLAAIYLLRAVAIVIFLLVPLTETVALLFAASFGFLWLGTVPLTSGLVAIMFGARYLSTLYGIVFFSHQIGSFLGVWMGGYLFDTTGSYDIVWYLGIALGVFAALVHLPIREAQSPTLAGPLKASA